MSFKVPIIKTEPWLETPLGRYVLAWEQETLDGLVADVFGFHALQIGAPALDALRCNRMPHRWVMSDGRGDALSDIDALVHAESGPGGPVNTPFAACIQADFDALPFPSNSLDLVVLPHTLELSDDAHQTLREVERVLMPEGRVVVLGFNPLSLWGARQLGSEVAARLGASEHGLGRRFLPTEGELIGWRRLRDWLRLLGFEVERSQFGCYRPPVKRSTWLDRYAWTESFGERWWPVMGAVYATVAVKRVRGMRMIGPSRKARLKKGANAPAVVTRGGSFSEGIERDL